MKSVTNAAVISQPLSRAVIDRTPANAFLFLKGATNPDILRQLQAAGYTSADHAEGWRLCLRVTEFATPDEPESPENKAAKAVAEISSWVGQGFARARAVWDRKFPEVSAYVFKDIDGSNAGAVCDLATFLDRLGELKNGADRKATRKSDHAALEALAQRGIGDAVLENMTSLLETSKVQPAVTPIVVKDDGRIAAVTELYVWLRDWRETARAVIRNRSHLISLGIGKRRVKNATPAPSPVTITPAAASAPPAPLMLVSGSKNA